MLRAMPAVERQQLLACCVAWMLGTPAPVGPRAARPAALGELEICWDTAFQPDEAVLGRLSKSELHRIARERLGPEDIDLRDLGGKKKSEMVEAVAEGFRRYRERSSGRAPWIPDAIAERDDG
ncbi:MAG: hypothetical protein OXN81_03385 [Alphaproteobacteria bacterium]|nr:hypothetical protein [Alphaproteobacteria bacterium]